MSNHTKKKKNSITKSVRFVFKQARKGSKLHIGMLAAVVLIFAMSVFMLTGCLGGNDDDIVDDYVENEIDQSYDKDREALDVEQLGLVVENSRSQHRITKVLSQQPRQANRGHKCSFFFCCEFRPVSTTCTEK